VYFNVNFNVFFKLIQVHLLVSELFKQTKNSERQRMERGGEVNSRSGW